MADKYQPDLNWSLRYLYNCIVVPTITSKYVDDPGAADLTVTKGGRAAKVEVKTGEGGPKGFRHAGDHFPFAGWRENQREWAVRYCRSSPYSTEYWLAIFCGVDSPHMAENKVIKATKKTPAAIIPNISKKTGKQAMPRRCWLIPYQPWVEIEAKILPIQKSLPYRVGRCYDVEMQAYQYDLVTLLERWEMPYQKGHYTLPLTHPFYQMYIGIQPLPLYSEAIIEVANHAAA